MNPDDLQELQREQDDLRDALEKRDREGEKAPADVALFGGDEFDPDVIERVRVGYRVRRRYEAHKHAVQCVSHAYRIPVGVVARTVRPVHEEMKARAGQWR